MASGSGVFAGLCIRSSLSPESAGEGIRICFSARGFLIQSGHGFSDDINPQTPLGPLLDADLLTAHALVDYSVEIEVAVQMAVSPEKLVWLDLVGCLVWFVGFLFEGIGDRQLAKCKSDPNSEGKVMNRGLWAYTRNPNYFGESLIWWGGYLINLTHMPNYWTAISPLFITFLLLRVSGIKMLERDISERRPEYEAYIENTNTFIPWFPKMKTDREMGT